MRLRYLAIIVPFVATLLGSGCVVKSNRTESDAATVTEFIFTTSLIESNGNTNENLLLFEKSQSSCSLTLLNTYTVGPDPYDLVYHKGTSTLYVANSYNTATTPTIHAFKFNTSTKTLTSAGTATQTGPDSPTTHPMPFMMAVHDNGYLFSVDGNPNGSIGYFNQTTTTGAIAQFTTTPFLTTSTRLWFIALAGNHVYVNDYGANVIRQYSVNPTTGILTALANPTDPTGNNPWSMFLHPSGNYLYTTNSGSGTVSQYARNTTTGELAPIGSPVAAGANTIGLAVGTNYVYASSTNTGRIYQFAVNTADGTLAAHGAGFVSTLRPNPYGMRLSKNEDCLYVAELDGINGASANDEIGIYSVSGGTLTRQGSISGGIGPRFFALAY